METKSNFLGVLHRRELNGRPRLSTITYGMGISTRLNSTFANVFESIKSLREAVASEKWSNVTFAVGSLLTQMLDHSAPSQLFAVTPARRRQREVFVSLGGVDLLLKLFAKPFNDPDARMINAVIFKKRAEVMNEVLVILREISYAIPTFAENYFSNNHIVFLFTLLHHQSVFENSMNLLEEILAMKLDTFLLGSVPKVCELIAGFNPRQLAHFCRVLSLLLFEPEDRLILEGSHVLRSYELLQLRRDRMAKVVNVVERNQTAVRSICLHPTSLSF